MNIKNSMLETIGNTPLVKLNKLCKNSNIYLKLESFNPTGSIKVRPALRILADAEINGVLKKDSTIIESSSGNFGIALSMIGAIKGYKVIIVIDPRTSKMHRTLIEAYNGKTVMVRHKENGSFQIARINKVKQLAKKIKNSFVPNQYSNAMNPRAHYESTAKELIQDLDGKIDYLVAAVSTGGTISGNARKLKEKIKNIKIVAVDSVGSVIFGGKPKPRFMTGMGANFTPTNLDLSIIDKVIKVSDRDAFKTCKELSKKEGILVGGSSGAAVCAALKLAKNNLQKEKNIVVIAPDAGNFYLDTFFSKNWCRKNSIF